MQLIVVLALLLGGIYLLYSLGRAASGMERMADAFEEWVALQQPQQPAAARENEPPALPRTPLPAVPPTASSESAQAFDPTLEKDEREHDVTKNL